MRLFNIALAALLAMSLSAHAEDKPKANANPCRDEVAAALQKLRNASWFRMQSFMITENGPTNLQVDYVLPDRMHQKINVVGQSVTQEVILVGDHAWANEGEGWRILPPDITEQLTTQMRENVLSEQKEVGNYSCKGRVTHEGKDVMSYKLEDDPGQNKGAPKNEAFRMFYVDAVTGLPVSNAIVTPGREDKPIFKTQYSFPLDIKIEAPKDAKPLEAPAAAATPEAETKPATKDEPKREPKAN